MDNIINCKVKKAFSDVTPDIFDSILAKCNEQKGSAVIMTTKKRNTFKKFVSLAAALIIVIAGLGVFGVYQSNNAVESTIALDVNPCIKIDVNKNEKVLDVTALNEDAEKIIGTMDFKNSDLTVTVNALIGSMLRNGYLSDIANSVLVTVEGKDHNKNEEIQKKLTEEINTILNTNSIEGAVLTQEFEENKDVDALAEKHGISKGKAKIAKELAEELKGHTADELAELSINELNILAEKSEKISSEGTASKKAYIGEEKALVLLLDKVGVAKEAAKFIEVEIDSDDGVMVYEIEFVAEGFEYDGEVDALSGKIIKWNKELNDDPVNLPVIPDNTTNNAPESTTASAVQNNTTTITEAKAKEIALKKAGLTANEVKGYFCEKDFENGIAFYEIEFYANGFEYSCEINASTGKIVDFDKEYDDDYKKPVVTPEKPVTTTKVPVTANKKPVSDNLIGKAKAKEIALNHAGLNANAVKGYICETDIEKGVTYYEIEFNAEGYEYSYEINASTGKIVDYDKEYDDDYRKPVTTTKAPVPTTEKDVSANLIGKAKAKEIALERAGLTASEIKGYSCETDIEKGVTYYEIEFKANGYEYSCEINASTGKIVDFDKEYDD